MKNAENFKDAKFLKVSAGVRYWEDAQIDGVYDDEDNPKMQFVNDTEIVRGIKKYWRPVIDLDKGQIVDWNVGTSAFVHYKVCDDGHYELLDENKEVIANADDWNGGSYVPTILDCSEDKDSFGDYIILIIDENGFIKDFDKRFDGFTRITKE
ncbi:MAG: hypothetical protein LBQ39_07815 [Tannerellaceae bacterium]|jgi:hypothetical protein|nr:hypothetical protein [Tannerellaceae bacterium]